MLSDFYPLHERQIVYGFYYLAVPVGAAIGFGIGAIVGSIYSWRVAFYVCGIPGIIIALSVLAINDPQRGINDPARIPMSDDQVVSPLQPSVRDFEQDDTLLDDTSADAKLRQSTAGRARVGWKQLGHEFALIPTNPMFMFVTMGQAANAFALGGIADWYATFLLRYDNVTLESAGLIAGAATIVGGILGTLLGSKLADHFDGRVKSAYLVVPALFCIPSALCCLWAVNAVGNSSAAYTALFFTQIFAWTATGPINAVAVSCVPPHLRARAGGVLILLIHCLGDVVSPPIIGAISDATHSLRTGMQCTWIAFIVSGLWWGAAGVLLKPLSYALDSADKVETAVTYYDILYRNERR